MAKNKIKTRKTLVKRIKITKGGKILKKRVSTGHLKVKLNVKTKHRKKKLSEQENRGHIKKFKKLLGKAGGKIK
jgi:ribosomal protein L35